jgi:hypothetical protein
MLTGEQKIGIILLAILFAAMWLFPPLGNEWYSFGEARRVFQSSHPPSEPVNWLALIMEWFVISMVVATFFLPEKKRQKQPQTEEVRAAAGGS